MSRKVCRRKHYPLIDCVTLAIEGAGITQSDKLDKLRLVELSAIESFAKGRATPHDWRTVADILNLAETMAKCGVGPEALEACAAVDAALSAAHARHESTGKLGMTGPQLIALRELAEWHDLQRRSIARSEYERFIVLTANRIRSSHPDVKVFI